jgi:hypothetical protein
MAALQETVQPDEEGVGGELPLAFSLCFVLEVGIFELSANVDCQL